MARSTDVNLPREHKARFPDRCVVCDCNSPNSKARVITGSVGWWTWILWWWGTPFMVRVPACRSCGWRFQARRAVGVAIVMGAVAIVYFWGWPYLQDVVPRSLRRWVILGLTIVVLMPYVFFDIFFAPPFQMTAYSDNVDYEFADSDYAIDFATLNQDAAWVKLDGETVPFDDLSA